MVQNVDCRNTCVARAFKMSVCILSAHAAFYVPITLPKSTECTFYIINICGSCAIFDVYAWRMLWMTLHSVAILFDIIWASPNIYEWDDESRIDSPRNNMELLIEDFVSIISTSISTLIIILFLYGVHNKTILYYMNIIIIVIRIVQQNLFWVLTRLNVFRVISGSNQKLNLPQL